MKSSKLTIDGAEYTLAEDFNAKVKAEELTGLNLLVPDRLDSATLRGLFLARVLLNHPEVTAEKACALISAAGEGVIMEAIVTGPADVPAES